MDITLGSALAVSGAALALGVSGFSTAVGLKAAGVAGAGAVAEKKENFRSALILQALPQTQTIYGFIIALFILIGIGVLGGGKGAVTLEAGLTMLGAGLVMAITGASAAMQGLVSASGIISCSKNPAAFTPSIVFSGQVETPAIFGFLIALLILVMGIGIF
ncbi:V-type ATP synthase subunit K [Candidatus Woesearchaeota archaeon]|nr:V-type ATP synthase subunit K [Candidatus Woesearchaeota archaeon]